MKFSRLRRTWPIRLISRPLIAVACSAALAVTGLAVVDAPAAWAAGPNVAYTANAGSNNVSVIDVATNSVTATIPVGSTPQGVTENAAGTRVYVTNNGAGTVSVIDTSTNSVTATISGFSRPAGIAVSPDGTRVYVVNVTSQTVSVIDTSTNTITGTAIPVGTAPFRITASPDGSRVYVANQGVSPANGTISVISTATATVVDTITVGRGPLVLKSNPAGTLLYVANQVGNTVSVINTPANTIAATITVGSLPQGVAVSPDGSEVYVTNQTSNNVSVIDAATNTVAATIAVGTGPVAAAFNATGSYAYVTNFNAGTVSVIDTSTRTSVATVTVGTRPYDIAPDLVPPPAPVVTAISPTSGPTTGSTVVTVTGTNFTGATAVTFGGTPGTGLTCTATSCTVTSPAHAAGTVDVQVTTPGGTSATSAADQFTYVAAAADIDVDVTAQPHLGILVPYLTYTLTARDLGPGAATSATVTASLPPGASATNLSTGCTTATGTVTCTYGPIANGTAVNKTFRIPLNLLSLGHVTVTGVRTASAPADPNAANDSASATCTVISIVLATCP